MLLWFVVILILPRSAAAHGLPPDIVGISGAEIPSLVGTPTTTIAAVAMHWGSPTPVHLQIDRRRRDAGGGWRYVFDSGTVATERTPTLQEGDLILLAVAEGGERAEPLPPGSVEIEVAAATGARSRWFYVQRGPHADLPPLVRYDAASDEIRGQDYAMGFSRTGTAVIDKLVLGNPASGTDILDRSKARLEIALAFGITVSRTEDDVRVRTTGLHVGPLRIIRQSEVRGRMLLGFYSPPVRDDFIFYPHGFVLPTTIHLTRAARFLTRRVTLRISMDLNPAAGGLTFESSPELPAPLLIDGQGGQQGGGLPIAWYLLRHKDIGLLGWLQAPSEIAREVTLYYRDDRSHDDPPETDAGEFGDHGFLFQHVGALPAGTVRLSSYGWVQRGAELDAPSATLRAFASPPTVRVH